MDEVKKICSCYDKTGSVTSVAKKLGVSWCRIVKILSSEGYILSDNHRKIIELHKQGLSKDEIAARVKVSVKTVRCYSPAVRPYYKYKRSKNALKIARWRQNKNNKEQ